MKTRLKGYAVMLAAVILAVSTHPEPAGASPATPQSVQSGVQYVHDTGVTHVHMPDDFCGTDFSSDQARGHLEAYLQARSAGRLASGRRVAKMSSPPDIGDDETFNVFENDSWTQLEFRLKDITDRYYLWVEIAEIQNGNVTDAEIAEIKENLLSTTPSRSYNPSQGILDNNHEIFGQAPDVDGDGIVDLLLYDIGRGTGTTLGYVHPADFNPGAGENVGNHRDVLYLDSDQGTRRLDDMAAIAAHEYTHLVHATYGWDEAFVTEGYAEYAMVLNGYFWRNIRYLNVKSEIVDPLFKWEDGGGTGAMDYERAGLLFTYIANQTSPQAIGKMLRGPVKKGGAGIDSVLTREENSSLSQVLLGFHTANLVNDPSLGKSLGYEQPERSHLKAVLTRDPIDGEDDSNVGEGGHMTELSDDNLARPNTGAAKYFRWESVSDFVVRYDTPGWRVFPAQFQEEQRQLLQSRNRLRLLFEPVDGSSLVIEDVVPSGDNVTFSGKFESVTAIFTHLDPDVAVPDQVEFTANWTPLSKATPVEDAAVLPSITELGQNYPNPFNPSTTIPVTIDRSMRVSVEVFDLLGRRMTVVADEILSAGEHLFHVRADGWPSGTYLIRMRTDRGVQTKRMALVK